MNRPAANCGVRRGHTLIELMAAMIASAFLLAGMGSVMFIARQVAYTPSAATRRAKSADIAAQITDELRFATIIIQQTPTILEFIVTDRNADGTAEKIRYEWSGAAGAPLRKTINGATAVDILPSVNDFSVTFQQKSKTAALTTTTDSAEAVLLANTAVVNNFERDITNTNYHAQQKTPAAFGAIPANALSWNATKIDFYGLKSGNATETLLVQLRATGDPNDQPTSNVLGQVSVAETALGAGAAWHTVTFASPIRNLAFSRKYDMVFVGVGGAAAKLVTNELFASGMLESTDSGASWQAMTSRQMYGRLYGTYTTPGTSYNVTRNYVSHVRLVLQSGNQSHARVDTSAPLGNTPEILSTYWRSDFDHNPATTNANGDAVADWAVTGGGNFDTTKLINGVWYAAGAIETRPLADFTTTTTVEVRCRNTSVGGNGAVVRINADRQGGQYAPLLIYVQRQSDGTQTLTLNGKSSDAATTQLFSRSRLASGFVRVRLTIVPQNNVVNMQINGEDQGTFTYPTYAPAINTDRYLTLFADTSAAEFDYVDVRAGTN